MDIDKAKKFILDKQRKEFPDGLYYHNIHHVLDVYTTVIKYIEALGITHNDGILLQTAALFHDSGFIIQAASHEEISCTFAKQYLPDFGYNEGQVEAVCGMIRATKIPQSPQNNLEEILADADLDYLGRDDFFTISDNLYLELKQAGTINNENQWNQIQIAFFESHHYFTTTAMQWRQDKKEQHLQKIKSKIS